MEEARAELRACMEKSMPAYIDQGVEHMFAHGERLQKMEQQHNELPARYSKLPSDIAKTQTASASTSPWRTWASMPTIGSMQLPM